MRSARNRPLFDPVHVTWTVLSLWLAQISLVHSYADLRGTTCMMPYLKAVLPGARSAWGGKIYLTMECDPGYDLALNAPSGGIFSCRPDGSSWSPDYIPDCNKLIRPDQIYYVMAVPLHGECESLGQPFLTRDSISFQNGPVLDVRNVCKSINPKDGVCVVDKVEMHCDGTQTLDEHGKNLKTKLPSMYIKIRSSYSDNFDMARFKTTAADILTFMKPPHNISSGVLSKLRVDCPLGTLGLIDGHSGIVCRGCSLGYFLTAGNKTCSPCPPGYYSDTPMSVACRTCPALVGVTSTSKKRELLSKAKSRTFSISMCPAPTDFALLTSEDDKQTNKTAAVKTSSGSVQLHPTFIGVIVGTTLTILILVAILSAIAEFMVIKMKKADAMKKPIPTSPSGACFTSPVSSSHSLAHVNSRLTSAERNRSMAIRAISRGFDGVDMAVNYVP